MGHVPRGAREGSSRRGPSGAGRFALGGELAGRAAGRRCRGGREASWAPGGGGHQQRAVARIKVRRIDLVHRCRPRVGGGLGAEGAAQGVGMVRVRVRVRMRVRVRVVRVRVVPGLRRTLVQVAVQRGRRVGVGGGEGHL